MSLIRSIATVGGFTMLSRITGLMRESMVANYLGASILADAFLAAFRFPNLFRSLFAEGAFNAAFVPLFSGKLAGEGPDAARAFAEQAFIVMALVLSVVVALMELAMPWMMMLLAPGFLEVPGKMDQAVEFARICFPYLLFISLTALQAGVLNCLGRFAAAAGTPILLNVVAMAGLWGLMPYTETAGHALAWGTFAAGVVQFVWLVFSLRSAGMPLRLVRPRLTPEVKNLATRIVPGAIGAGVYQLNLVINTMIASTVGNGAISYLNYADRVNQLPLGVVGIAVGVALLPLLSRQLREGQMEAARESQNRAIEFALLLTLPASAALIVIAEPVVRVLFQRGAFGVVETQASAAALMALASGLPAFVLVKVLVPAFFARGDTKTPMGVAGASMVINVVLNLALVDRLAHVGMAVSTSIAAWFNVLTLLILLKRRDFFAMDRRLCSRGLRLLFAALVMGGGVWQLRVWVWSYADNFWKATGLLTGLVLAGGLLFAGVAAATGGMRWGELRKMMRRTAS